MLGKMEFSAEKRFWKIVFPRIPRNFPLKVIFRGKNVRKIDPWSPLWVWRMKVGTLGSIQMYCAGKIVALSQQKKPTQQIGPIRTALPIEIFPVLIAIWWTIEIGLMLAVRVNDAFNQTYKCDLNKNLGSIFYMRLRRIHFEKTYILRKEKKYFLTKDRCSLGS
jgi:hypothetical protein